LIRKTKKEPKLFFPWEIILHIKTWGVEATTVKGLKISLASQVPVPHACKSYLLRSRHQENHCLKQTVMCRCRSVAGRCQGSLPS
jgi:hypothetical protein